MTPTQLLFYSRSLIPNLRTQFLLFVTSSSLQVKALCYHIKITPILPSFSYSYFFPQVNYLHALSPGVTQVRQEQSPDSPGIEDFPEIKVKLSLDFFDAKKYKS